MMNSKKEREPFDWQTSSVMRWLSGEEVIAYLDWDENRYYLRFEPTGNFEDFCKEIGREDMLIGLENELAQIGVQSFYDLDSVNKFCERYCGDEDPAEFYEDEWGNICGA